MNIICMSQVESIVFSKRTSWCLNVSTLCRFKMYSLLYVILYRYAMGSQNDQLPDRGLVAQLAVYCIRIAQISFSSDF